MRSVLAGIPHEASIAILVRNVPRKRKEHEEVISLREQVVAESFGRTIARRCRILRYSPDERSQKTAVAIARGFGSSGIANLRSDPVLGEPSIFVVGSRLEQAKQQFDQLGKHGVVAALGSGILVPGWIAQAEPAARDLVSHCHRQLADEPGIGVFVTYDVVLMLLVSCLTRRFVPDGWWPSFLEAVTLWTIDGGRTMGLVDRWIDQEFSLEGVEVISE